AIDFDDKALIIKERCISCYLCLNYCPVGAIEKEE
ncbi:MAG TPA: ferredoxin, partial [Thermoplasmatales archaeon]|nr:ferredoxin [Thermoplasmatales archaeon]HEX17303.1 ferredoxin [Thermoplasmatales archaeon]